MHFANVLIFLSVQDVHYPNSFDDKSQFCRAGDHMFCHGKDINMFCTQVAGGDWVNPSKRVGMDMVFQGLAAPRDFPRSKPEGNPGEQHRQPEGNPVHLNSFTWIYILFKTGHFGDIPDFFSNIDF